MSNSAVEEVATGAARGPLVVVSGPSGVGKTTVVEAMLASDRLPLRRGITATSRQPRPGEVDGRDYHFWSDERFRQAIAAGDMLEHAIVHGSDYYGTPRSEVDPWRARGVGVILVIDVQGAAAVRALYPGDHLSIFLTVPARETLRERLQTRGEAPERIERRLKTAEAEFLRAAEFDKVVVNEDLQSAIAELTSLIEPLFRK